ncbi:MAG: LamG domain-containing protein, partial [Candidatus Absconditicoccaceae bacterium]
SGYIWQLSTDSFSSVYLSGTTTNTGINISSLPQDTYQWRVVSIDKLNQTGTRSTTYSFTVDTIPPPASIEYTPSTNTNLDVTAMLTGFSEDGITITNNNGSGIYIFTGNGTFTFEFQDSAGNTGSASAIVTWIDKTLPPTLTGITLIPTLNASHFADYSISTIISGNIVSGSVDLQGINGDGTNCIHYYVSGSCIPFTFTYPLSYSGGQVWQATGIRPDQIYPQIFFAPSTITRNNPPNNTTLTRNSYSLFHMQNNFSMVSGSSFWIELNTLRRATNSVNLSVYLVERGHDLSYFNSNRLSNSGVELVGTITNTTNFDHEHTVNSAHNLIALSTNSSGNIGTKNINISGDFWIVLYPNTTNTNRGRDLRYQPSSICDNTSGWYMGNQGAGWTTTAQSGCPDSHIHIARKDTKIDGVNAVVKATYTGGLGTGEISGFNDFYFGVLPNMAPNPTSFISPTSGSIYSGNIDISWNPATDPNNDILSYNIYLLSNTGTVLQTLITGNTNTQYTLNKGVISDGEYSLKIEACDTESLCSESSLDDNFFIDTIPPTASIEYTPSTNTNLDVAAMLTGFSEDGITITNNNGSGIYIFTGNGTFIFEFEDISGHTGSTSAIVTWIDKNGPTLSMSYISSGSTGYNLPNYYYRGNIDIMSYVSDTNGLSTGTCMYTIDGLIRSSALYSGTSMTGYCYKTGLNFTSDLNIRFSIQDNISTTGYSDTGTYLYDNIAPTSGSFIINDDSSYINTTGITLNVTCPVDTGVNGIQIAYGNSPNPSNWTICTSTTGHNLTTGDGLKTVYVLFRDSLLNTTTEINKTIILDTTLPNIVFTGYTPLSGSILNSNNFIAELEISDANGINDFDYSYSGILYNIYDSGLLLMYNFDKLTSLGESGTYVRDFSQYGKNGIVSGGSQWNNSGVWNGAYSFDGTSGYIQTNQPISWQMNSFTVSAWFNTTGSYDGKIISSSVSRHQLQVYNGYLRTCLGVCTVGTTPINDGNRHFATVVGDTTSIRVYLDGNTTPEITVSSGSSTTINDIFRIGAVGAGAGSDGLAYFFRGTIDEPRIYNRALSQQEIYQLYRSNLSAIDTGKWLYSSNYTCVITGGNHIYSGYVSDLSSNYSGIVRTNIINLPNPISNISASQVSIGTISSSLISNQILSGQSVGYFSVSDWMGNTGWYTNITLPLNLVSADNVNHIISGSQIYFKSNGINTISGLSTNDIYVAGNLSDYVNVPSATTYIKRDPSDIPFMCPGGVYGNKPWFRVDVPAGQSLGSYSGTITYDIVY